MFYILSVNEAKKISSKKDANKYRAELESKNIKYIESTTLGGFNNVELIGTEDLRSILFGLLKKEEINEASREELNKITAFTFKPNRGGGRKYDEFKLLNTSIKTGTNQYYVVQALRAFQDGLTLDELKIVFSTFRSNIKAKRADAVNGSLESTISYDLGLFGYGYKKTYDVLGRARYFLDIPEGFQPRFAAAASTVPTDEPTRVVRAIVSAVNFYRAGKVESPILYSDIYERRIAREAEAKRIEDEKEAARIEDEAKRAVKIVKKKTAPKKKAAAPKKKAAEILELTA